MGPHVALVAVVGGLVLDAALVADVFSLSDEAVAKDLDAPHGLQQAVSGDDAVSEFRAEGLVWGGDVLT